MSTFEFNALYKIGFVTFSLPEDVLQDIKSTVQKDAESNFKSLNPYNDRLVGFLTNEYHYPKVADQLLATLQKAATTYGREYNKDASINIELVGGHKDIWINFQKKNEYNPPHNHQGDLSFVIWINIPFDREQELKNFRLMNAGVAESDAPGSFSFLIPDPSQSGGIRLCNFALDKSYEGKGVMFHSSLLHMVYPFMLSDDYRVSIAGNLRVGR